MPLHRDAQCTEIEVVRGRGDIPNGAVLVEHLDAMGGRAVRAVVDSVVEDKASRILGVQTEVFSNGLDSFGDVPLIKWGVPQFYLKEASVREALAQV